jgi:hypothetical protein
MNKISADTKNIILFDVPNEHFMDISRTFFYRDIDAEFLSIIEDTFWRYSQFADTKFVIFHQEKTHLCKLEIYPTFYLFLNSCSIMYRGELKNITAGDMLCVIGDKLDIMVEKDGPVCALIKSIQKPYKCGYKQFPQSGSR